MKLNFEFTAGNVKSAMKEAGATSSDLWKVPRDKIKVVPGFNVRNPHDDPDYVRSLADSIKENGYYNDRPLTGYVGKEGGEDVIYLTDGGHRIAAVDLLISEGVEMGNLPVVIKPRGTSMEDITIALYTSNTGKPLTPLETGLVCKRLIGFGMEEKDIAKRLSITRGYVDDLLNLVGSPTKVRELVLSGKVSSTMAIQALKDYGEDAADKLGEAVSTAAEFGKKRATAKHLKTKNETSLSRFDKVVKLLSSIQDHPDPTLSMTQDVDTGRFIVRVGQEYYQGSSLGATVDSAYEGQPDLERINQEGN